MRSSGAFSRQSHEVKSILHPSEPRGPQDIVLDSEIPATERALAVTLDRAIQVGPDASLLSNPGLARLLAHESVHVAQQNLPGRPGTRAQLEREANGLAPLALAGKPFRPLVPASPRIALRTEQTIGTDAANQQAWVRRIDTIVRDRFGLTRVPGRMTDRGRVVFQDVATFARGFGDRPRDLLVEAFAEDLGDVIYRIQDFYNFHENAGSPAGLASVQQFVDEHISSGFLYWNHHALDWTDYGLAGINSPRPFSSFDRVPGNPNMVTASLFRSHVTQAEAEEATRRRPGVRYRILDGRTWSDPEPTQNVDLYLQVPLSRVTNRISAGEILAEAFGGVTTGGARGSRRIRIRSTPAQPEQPAVGGRPVTPAVPARPANVSTLVHEACHFYAHDNFKRFVDSVRRAGTTFRMPMTMSIRTSASSIRAIGTSGPDTMRLAPILEEGFTEYFTRMLMQEQADILGTAGTGSYPSQYEAARLIIGSLRPPSAAESAYFQGNSADIRKVRDVIPVVEQYPLHINVEQEAGADEGLEALERLRAPAPQTPPEQERMRPRPLQDVRER
jgi:hypothetical protein